MNKRQMDAMEAMSDKQYIEWAKQHIAQLEAALREARPWIVEDTDALEACHTPYDPENDVDDQVRLEVDARREWLRSTLETKACTCDSTLVTDTSNHQPHCPRYQAETPVEPKSYGDTVDEWERAQVEFESSAGPLSPETGEKHD